MRPQQGCPTWFMLSNHRVIEGYIDLKSATAYMKGKPCDIIGTAMLLPEKEEVRIDDLLIKMVLGPDYEVHTN